MFNRSLIVWMLGLLASSHLLHTLCGLGLPWCSWLGEVASGKLMPSDKIDGLPTCFISTQGSCVLPLGHRLSSLLEPEGILSWQLTGGVGLELEEYFLPSGKLPGWDLARWRAQGSVSSSSSYFILEMWIQVHGKSGKCVGITSGSSCLVMAASSLAPVHTPWLLPSISLS